LNKWQRLRLEQCCEVVGGSTPKTSVPTYWDGTVPWATPRDVADLDGKVISDTQRRLTHEGLASCGATVLPVGSVLLSSRAPIGHVAINSVPMATNQGFKSQVPRTDLVHSGFLYWWLKSKRTYLAGLGNGATFKEVSKAVVSRVEIALPPLPEQRRLTEILDRTDALWSMRRAFVDHLDGLPSSAFWHEFGDPVVNPSRLPVVRLGDLIDTARPITYGILMPGPHCPGGVKYVRVVDLKERGVDLTGVRQTTHAIATAYQRSTLRPGDLLLSIRGHVGRLAVVPRELEGANITQDTARLAVVAASPSYVLECLRTPGMQRWMARHTKGVAVRGINLGDVKRIPIPVPSLHCQASFAHRLARIEKIRVAARESLFQIEALFTSIQYRAFRGDL
jgi:type I restriction enzyme S subunit